MLDKIGQRIEKIFEHHVIMKGLTLDNISYMFLGLNPRYGTDEYGDYVVRFSNVKGDYHASRIYYRVRSYRSLIRWMRLLGKEDGYSSCLTRNFFKWRRI